MKRRPRIICSECVMRCRCPRASLRSCSRSWTRSLWTRSLAVLRRSVCTPRCAACCSRGRSCCETSPRS
ncbi:hypothetical protein FQN60_007336 [Etheostoma spectabile]|uniref:Uncharacterized protein n=1 Tax=Etheostoma spectabile TaxID=54343 RepID=A0A5J5CBX6_9PERO|nr:hypothetical protein FQN60_007336 [Etheostoma spectabile]